MASKVFKVRPAKRDDCPEIIRLIQDLANYEKMPDGPKLTAEILEEDGFGDDPFYRCFVAEDESNPDRQLLGYVLFFYTYSTWEGRSVYMEDIFVSPSHRGLGIGTSLWKSCVQAALDKGCSRCNFSVLNWNQSSIDFYNNKGCLDLTKSEGWHAFRMNKDEMIRFTS